MQLSTKQAQDALQQLDAKLGALAAAFTQFKAADAAIDALGQAIGKIPTLNPATVTGLNSLTKAINSLSKVDKLTVVAEGLKAIGAVNVNAAATGIQSLATALGGLKIPRNLERLGQNIAKIGNEAQMGAKGVASFGAALATIRGAAGLQTAANGLNQVAQNARTATTSVQGFSNAWSTMTGVLGAVGLQTGAAGLAEFVKSSVNAAVATDQFKIKLDAVGEGAGVGMEAMKYLNDAVERLGLPLGTSIEQFGKLSAAMLQSGNDMDDTKKVFEGFGTAFRVLGASSEQVKRGFNAVAQVFQKGTVSSEELKQQLGEIIPAFGLLADAIGETGEDLTKMLVLGQVEASSFITLADKMIEKFGPGLKASLVTASGGLIAVERALFRIQTVAGKTILAGMTDAIFSFSRALESASMNNFIVSISTVIGLISQGLAGAFGIAINALSMVATGVNVVVGAFSMLGGAFTSIIGGSGALTAIFNGLAYTFEFIGTPMLAVAIAFGTVSAAIWTFNQAMSLAGGAIQAFSSPIFRTMAIVAGLTALVVLAGTAVYAFYQSWKNGTDFTAEFNSAIESVKGTIGGLVTTITGSSQATTSMKDSFIQVQQAADMSSAAVENATIIAGQATDGFGNVTASAAPAAEGLGMYGNAALKAGTPVDTMATATTTAATSMTQLDEASNGAATGVSELGTSASNASGSLSGTAGSISSVANSANSAIGPVNALTDALNDLAAAKARAGGGGGGGGGGGNTTVDSFSGGGTTNRPSSRTQSVPMSAFVNAPRLDTGIANTNGLPGAGGMGAGGIPAVLHPNEAVVPLAGGGSIPVVSDGGGIQAALYKVAEDTLQGVRQIDDDINRVWEQVRAQTTIQVNAFKFVNTNLLQIHDAVLSMNQSVVEAIGKIELKAASGGGGGGGGGGDFDLGGGGGGGDDTQAINNALNQLRDLRNQSEQIALEMSNFRKTNGFKWGTGSAPIQFGVKDQATYDNMTLRSQQINDSINAFTNQNQDLLNSAYIKQYQDLMKRGEDIPQGLEDLINNIKSQRGGRLGFAMGSPNASKDATGGFQATLHPDEAVIPLPDGRAVPVSLPAALMRRMESGGMGGGGGDQRPNIFIEMKVMSPDANSFRAGKNQMINDLRAQIERTANKVGPPRRRVEDPTKKLG